MISFILNLPYTLLGLLLAIYLKPKEIRWETNPCRIVIRVKKDSFGIDFLKGWRGMTVGHTIILNSREEEKVLEHEIVHVQQYEKFPFIFPILYYTELWMKGYKRNKYEIEAYEKAGNSYPQELLKADPNFFSSNQ